MNEREMPRYTLPQAEEEAAHIQKLEEERPEAGYDMAEWQAEREETHEIMAIVDEMNRQLHEFRAVETREPSLQTFYEKRDEFQKRLGSIPELRQTDIADIVALNGGADYIVGYIDQLPGADRKKIARTLMEIKRADLLLFNISKFPDVDLNEVAHKLVADRIFYTLVMFVDKFDKFDFVTTQVLSNSMEWHVILQYPEKFPEADAAMLERLRRLESGQ
jgi:hypothetical protein